MRPLQAFAAPLGALVLSTCLVPSARADTFQISLPGTIQIVDDDDGSLHLRLSKDGRTLKAKARGHFEFTDDETDFASVSPGGWFWIEERRRGRTGHRLEVRSQTGGGFERKYEVDGKPHEFDVEGRAWLADVLGEIFRRTTFAADSHLMRLFERDGVDGVLAEISQLESDHLAHRYYRSLLEKSPDATTARRVAEQAKKNLGSDHELSGLVQEIVENQAADESVLLACVQMTESIGSDHEHRRALESILDPGQPTSAVLIALFESATNIGSDHELAELLVRALEGRRLDAALAPSFFAATDRIGSDHESANVLSAVLEERDLEPAVSSALLQSSNRIGSDHEKAGVLLDFAASQSLQGNLREEFIESARGIGSDHERGRVLEALQEKGL